MTVSNRIRKGSSACGIQIEDTQRLDKFYEKNEEYRDMDSEYDGREALNKIIHFHIGDITNFHVDAIVCSTQTDLRFVPYGMHKKIMSRAGPVYEETCRQVGSCKVGKAFITNGYDLNAKNIIHTAGPPPDTTLTYVQRKDCLKQSYLSCLKIVKRSEDIKTVAIPSLGSGGAGIQLADALTIAVTTVREWLETGDNITHVHSIVLVMFDENQWNNYYTQLFKTFPYGKDLAGIDLEKLESVNNTTLVKLVPCKAVSTNILCYRYQTSALRHVTRHFHTVVNLLHTKLCLDSEPLERYKNSATFVQVSRRNDHRVIICHCRTSHTIEVQVICYSENPDNFHVAVCHEVQAVVKNYLTANLENVTSFETHIRCQNSTLGDTEGMINTQKLETNHPTLQCRHRNSTIHLIHPNEMRQFWIHQNMGSLPSVTGREPEEGVDSTYELEIYWPSLPDSGSLEPKLQNVPTDGGADVRNTACVAVEHTDESQGNEFKNFLTKSSKDSSENAKAEQINQPTCSYKSFNDSILSNAPKEIPICIRSNMPGKQQNMCSNQTDESERYHQECNNGSVQHRIRNGHCDQASQNGDFSPSIEEPQTSQMSGIPLPEEELQKPSRAVKRKKKSTYLQSRCLLMKQKGNTQPDRVRCTNNNTSNGINSRSINSPGCWGHTSRESTGNGLNSAVSTGNVQNTTGSGQSGAVNIQTEKINCEYEHCRGEGSTDSLSGELLFDSFGACGGTYSDSDKHSSNEHTDLNDDKSLLKIAKLIGNKETQLGLELGLTYACIQRIKSENTSNALMQAFCILHEWKIQQRGNVCIETLIEAMVYCSIDTHSLEIT